MKKSSKPTSPKPKFVPPAISKKKLMKCIPQELYNRIKLDHPEYFL